MRRIYIVLTHTGTVLSNIIRQYTKDEFSHISISLDEELTQMYSFGRLKPYNPFIGGFVHEGIDYGTFKRFRNTKTRIYSLTIDDDKYNKLESLIEYFEENKEKYKFNILGLFCVSIKKRIRTKNTFYCAEFVKHIMKFSGIKSVANLPLIIKPEHFKEINGLKLEYEGLLRKYNKKNQLLLLEAIKLKSVLNN